MSELVLNAGTRMCCGRPAAECNCHATPVETEFASNADLDGITGNRAPAVADLIPTIDDGDMLGEPVWNWAEIAEANRE